MTVDLYTVDQDTNEAELYVTDVPLEKFLEDNPDVDAEAELKQFGKAFIGGGAAQLFMIVLK